LRNYGIISVKQIFPYKNTASSPIYLSFYWFMQDIYTILLCIDIKNRHYKQSNSIGLFLLKD